MGSDRERISYDPNQQYRGVVLQQGRVTVAADANEVQDILSQEISDDALDFVGPVGTPDNGYLIGTVDDGSRDLTIGPGTMYVGGVRVSLAKPCTYSAQPDWLTPDPALQTGRELICLELREQEVSAVEDEALRDVALGGPDTAARLRIIQRIVRYPTKADTCGDALAEVKAWWGKAGLEYDDKTCRLAPSAKLSIEFEKTETSTDKCQPDAHYGFLDAENRMIRFQVAAPDKLLWGYDNASFIYRVDVQNDKKTLRLHSVPVDAAHEPGAVQVVEVLPSDVMLSNGQYIAAETGHVTTLAEGYDRDKQTVVLQTPIQFSLATGGPSDPSVFLRVWNGILDLPAQKQKVGDTGLLVSVEGTCHVGDYWTVALRPATPTQAYPGRYLKEAQPPDGPRRWVCPLAVIEWKQDDTGSRLADCRKQFDNLVELTQRKQIGCCTHVVTPKDAGRLQKLLSRLKDATVCFMPGTYILPQTLKLGRKNPNLVLKACREGVVLRADEKALEKFQQGLILIDGADRITLRGIEFAPPLVEMPDKLANRERGDLEGNAAAVLKDLLVCIGIRLFDCTNLTIEDCRFAYPAGEKRMVWGAGVLASGECDHLTVQRNRFLSTEDVRTASRFLMGYGMTPNSQMAAGEAGGRVVLSKLDNALFRDNCFERIAAAALIFSTAGAIKIESNTVRDCYGGFCLFDLASLPSVKSATEIMAPRTVAEPAARLYEVMSGVARDPVLQFTALLARGYPLPDDYDLRRSALVKTARPPAPNRISETDEKVLKRGAFVRAVINNGLTFNVRSERLATEPPTGDVANLVELRKPIPHVEPLVSIQAIDDQIGDIELQAIVKTGVHSALSLDFSNNEVICAATGDRATFPGLVVWDTDAFTASSVIVNANKIRSKSALPTVCILLAERCAVTGNLIFNEMLQENLVTNVFVEEKTAEEERLRKETFGEKPTPQGPASFLLVPGTKDNAEGNPAVAITGNVFRYEPFPLPTRPDGLPPWEHLNTEL
ncbi:MAG: DUF6519 domain-containing protein [Armatimonadota bacterium]|nr:DUF6519 domain-containing protein [Armatimonadota bacterium]